MRSATLAKPPTLAVVVNDWVPRKLDAIRCHRSQEGLGHPFEKVTSEEAQRWLGVEHFHRGAAGSSNSDNRGGNIGNPSGKFEVLLCTLRPSTS